MASNPCERGSFLHTMASTISQLAFDELDTQSTVIDARNWITFPDEIEYVFSLYASDIIDAVYDHMLPLNGYMAKSNRHCQMYRSKHQKLTNLLYRKLYLHMNRVNGPSSKRNQEPLHLTLIVLKLLTLVCTDLFQILHCIHGMPLTSGDHQDKERLKA